jgi:ribose-phosphate pyrophosphokinase
VRLKTRSGDLPFTQLTFPDGQRHLELRLVDRDFLEATIEARLRNADELFDVLLAHDALRASGYVVSLDIRYLLGARMDRRIDPRQPHTLQVVARILNNAGFQRIRILDPHSPVALELLGAQPVYPLHAVGLVLSHYGPEDTVIVAPDTGATARVSTLLALANRPSFRVVQGVKHRDSTTGRLSSFSVVDASAVAGKTCLILDDLCDGGGTFIGLAEVLHQVGAVAVDLFVTHGIFSKGTTLAGIRTIYTTDSYWGIGELVGPVVLRARMREP